jgi:hypothetical protein
MIKIIRNNQKKVLAGVGVVLMISFVASFGGPARNGRATRADREVGRAGGSPVMASEVSRAAAELSALNQYAQRFDRYGGSSSEADGLAHAVAERFAQQPELFVLLRREAVAAGVLVDAQEVQRFLDDHLGGQSPTDGSPIAVPSPESDAYDALRSGAGDALLVAHGFDQLAAAIKASRPAVDREMASFGQTIQLNLVAVPADPLAVRAPTTQQVTDQFTRYAGTAPDRPDPATNPFGFGYKVPVRVRVQYLRLPGDAVRKAVVATKSDYDWRELAAKQFYAHPEEFTAPPPPTTMGPSLPPRPPTLDQSRAKALDQVQTPLVEDLQGRVEQFLATTLARDWKAAVAAAKDHKPAPPTAVDGQAYTDAGYFSGLAGQVQAKFNVHVDVDATPQLSIEALGALPGLGGATASAASLTSVTSAGSLSMFLNDRSTSALANPDPTSPLATAQRMEPSPLFTERLGGGHDIVRLVAVAPAATATDLEAVRSTVEADCRTAAAYDLAKTQAAQLVAVATATGVLPSTDARPVLQSQKLTPDTMSIEHLRPELGDAAPDFMKQAFGLLATYDPRSNPHPATVIALVQQRRLFAAQLLFVEAQWKPDTYYQLRMEEAIRVRQRQVRDARLSWFGDDAIEQRAGWKPAAAAPTGS